MKYDKASWNTPYNFWHFMLFISISELTKIPLHFLQRSRYYNSLYIAQCNQTQWSETENSIRKLYGLSSEILKSSKKFEAIFHLIWHLLKDRFCTLFFRPRTSLQCFGLDSRCSEAKHCRDVLGQGTKPLLQSTIGSAINGKSYHL